MHMHDDIIIQHINIYNDILCYNVLSILYNSVYPNLFNAFPARTPKIELANCKDRSKWYQVYGHKMKRKFKIFIASRFVKNITVLCLILYYHRMKSVGGPMLAVAIKNKFCFSCISKGLNT